MKILKRLPLMLFSFCLCVSVCTVSAAYAAPEYDPAACGEILRRAGLLKGDGSGDLRLGDPVTRAEAVVMIARMSNGSDDFLCIGHPFQDVPAWADKYVGYAYGHGITSGVSADRFAPDYPVTLQQFTTMLLRGMGVAVDYESPYGAAKDAGIYVPLGCAGFNRGLMACMCVSAAPGYGIDLSAGTGLLTVSTGSQDVDSYIGAGPVYDTVTDVYVDGYTELLPALMQAMRGHSPTVYVHVPDGRLGEFYDRFRSREDYRMLCRMTDMEHGTYCRDAERGAIRFDFAYQDYGMAKAFLEGKIETASQGVYDLIDAARKISASCVAPGMTDAEVVKALHDYIVNTTRYDKDHNAASFSANGVFYNKSAVCEGYSEAMCILCYLNGIDCRIVTGYGWHEDGTCELHAWNKVKIGGTWYNVDATWDDPTGGRDILRYDYFLVSDETLGRDHTFDTDPIFWPAAYSDYYAGT